MVLDRLIWSLILTLLDSKHIINPIQWYVLITSLLRSQKKNSLLKRALISIINLLTINKTQSVGISSIHSITIYSKVQVMIIIQIRLIILLMELIQLTLTLQEVWDVYYSNWILVSILELILIQMKSNPESIYLLILIKLNLIFCLKMWMFRTVNL